MSHQLTDKEKQHLVTNFRLKDQLSDRDDVVRLDLLLDKEFLTTYLHNKKQLFHTDSVFVAGSQLMKRLGFLLAVPSLYALTTFNKSLPMELENCHLVSAFNDKNWLPKLYLHRQTVEIVEADYHNRVSLVANLFDNLYKLIEKISKVASVPRPILWENVAVYIYWLYETKIMEEVNFTDKKKIKHELEYLVKEVKPEIFREAYNPLARFYSMKHKVVGLEEPIRIRRTCCFYYETGENVGFCSTCPKSKMNKEACLRTRRNLAK